MARKQRNYRSGKRKTPRHAAQQSLSSLSRNILKLLYEADTQLPKQTLIEQLKKNGFSSDEINNEIERFLTEGYLIARGKNKLLPGPQAQIYKAVLDMTSAGFGFATNIQTSSGKQVQGKDLYIHRNSLLSAHHGDTVLVLAVPGRSGKKPEGRILAVLSRNSRNLIGFAVHEQSELVVYPEDQRLPFTVYIRTLPDASKMPASGDAVIVKLEDEGSSGRKIYGEILEILGDPKRIEVLTRMMAEKHQLPHRFSPEAEVEAAQASLSGIREGREDLREIQHVTIDGADAKDFDDAVAVEKTRNGYRLYVSIADVSAFVKPGSSLDNEAYERGTSVYFPGAVIPMLPENLSNNLCSLVPDEDRLTVTAIMEFDRDGVLRKKRFVRSIIRSHMRFTYDTVKQIVIDEDKELRKSFKPFLTPLKYATELAEILLKQRKKRGSIILNLSEAGICVENGDTVVSVTKLSRHFAHQMIEEFMLAANEAVALTFDEQGAAMLYRVHEEPDQEKVAEFIAISRILGLELPGISATSSWFCSLVEQVRDTDREFIVNNLLLRTMQQARYSHVNIGHFGLGATHYTHFTSPIRRYPDLIVHRLLCRLLDADRGKKSPSSPDPFRSLQEAGMHLSTRERNAVTAERDMMNKLKCRYMQGRIGDRFTGIISSLTDSLVFIDLIDHLISGAILLSDLTDDHYLYDHKRYRLIGDISGKIYQIGDIITVQTRDVDLSRNKIFFTVVSQ